MRVSFAIPGEASIFEDACRALRNALRKTAGVVNRRVSPARGEGQGPASGFEAACPALSGGYGLIITLPAPVARAGRIPSIA